MRGGWASVFLSVAACSAYPISRKLERLTDEANWSAKPGAAPARPVKDAIAQCYVEYVDGRELRTFNAPMVFTAYEGCMADAGYVQRRGED
ncbi:MAG: hypothetical protein ACRERC_13160 [Candidatus Binatia bacterium]